MSNNWNAVAIRFVSSTPYVVYIQRQQLTDNGLLKTTLSIENPLSIIIPTCIHLGQFDGQDFAQAISAAYTVHWCRNLFLVPSGKAGRDFKFVTQLARIFQSYAEGSALESVALKAVIVMPQLLLQKPSVSSEAKDHFSALS